MPSPIDESRTFEFISGQAEDCRINPVSLPNTYFWGFIGMDEKQILSVIRQKRDEIRPPRTWKEWLMPWTYPKLTSEQKWALKQFD
jgi:hypothetical protein